MNDRPAITVLMTVFNGGCHLAPAVQSILSQSHTDFEFLIVDDASTDGSIETLQTLAARDSRIRLLLNDRNKGQTACLNQGLREARGKWIARQDADDLSLPGRLAAQWEAVRSCPDLVLLGVNGWIIDEKGACCGLIHAPLHDSGIRWSMPFRNPFIHTGVMFRAAEGFYDEEFKICQDWEFWQRLAERGRMRNLPGRLVAYRHSASSLSHSSSDRTRHEAAEVVNRIWRGRFGCELEEQELLEAFREGLLADNRKRFWKFYYGMRNRWCWGDIRQAAAVHHFQVAGSLAGNDPAGCFCEMLAAFSESSIWTLQVFLGKVLMCPKLLKDFPQPLNNAAYPIS
jgi:glycosyltransferase involved in cell wall biosynthesis